MAKKYNKPISDILVMNTRFSGLAADAKLKAGTTISIPDRPKPKRKPKAPKNPVPAKPATSTESRQGQITAVSQKRSESKRKDVVAPEGSKSKRIKQEPKKPAVVQKKKPANSQSFGAALGKLTTMLSLQLPMV